MRYLCGHIGVHRFFKRFPLLLRWGHEYLEEGWWVRDGTLAMWGLSGHTAGTLLLLMQIPAFEFKVMSFTSFATTVWIVGLLGGPIHLYSLKSLERHKCFRP